MRRWFFVLLLLQGCASNRGEIREVARPAPPDAPRVRRFELELVARVATASRSLELFIPVASTEPGIQTIELTSTCISPDTPSEVTTDARGNRVLHVKRDGLGSVEVRVRQRILRRGGSVDLALAQARPLTPIERSTLAPELGACPPSVISLERVAVASAGVAAVTSLRDLGVPARPVTGLELVPGGASPVRWLEAYVPGLAWIPFVTGRPPGELPEGYLVISRGALGAAWALVDGEAVTPSIEIRRRDLPEEP